MFVSACFDSTPIDLLILDSENRIAWCDWQGFGIHVQHVDWDERSQFERKHSLAEDESLTSQHPLAEAFLAESMYRFIPLRQLQRVSINR